MWGAGLGYKKEGLEYQFQTRVWVLPFGRGEPWVVTGLCASGLSEAEIDSDRLKGELYTGTVAEAVHCGQWERKGKDEK